MLQIMLEESYQIVRRYSNKTDIIIFGTGNTAQLYQKSLEREDINPILYLDNNKEKENTYFNGVKVISPETLIGKGKKEYSKMLILICSGNIETSLEIKQQLNEMGCNYMMIDQYIFSKHKEDILKVYDLLEDNLSKKVYANIIFARAKNCHISTDIVSKNQYFVIPQVCIRSNKEVFVDFGAYVGDSIERYLWKVEGIFKNIYAFEPDPINYRAMEFRVNRLKKEWGLKDKKIHLINAGIGKEKDELSFSRLDTNSLSSKFSIEKDLSNIKVKIYSLDDFFLNKKITFLKADIEGYEYDMLLGGKQLIIEQKPKMAICIYHNASDMFDIPLLVKQLDNNYKLIIRHHSYTYEETVMYLY